VSAADLKELMALAKRVDESTFAKKNPGIYLIVRGTGDKPVDADARTTVRIMPGAPQQSPELRHFLIIPVVRSGTTPFADMVSVGRVEGNDIVIRHATVSKIHAFFSEVEPGSWTLTDKGSTNGTWVGGVRLQPDVPHKLGANEMVAFGQCHVALKGAAALWRFLELERRTA